MAGGVYYAFVGLWAGQFLTEGLGIDSIEAGWILVLSASSLRASPLFTWMAERCGSAKKVLVGVALAAAILSLPLALGLPALPPVTLSLYFVCFSVATFNGTALPFAIGKDLFSTELTGTISGVINMFPFAGTAALQQIMGFVVDRGTAAGQSDYEAMTAAFWVLTEVTALAFVLSLSIGMPGKTLKSATHTSM